MRPKSALQVAAALPGSNPLAAAIAAGETPSPEMVAAAGEEGSLSIWKAWSLLAAVATGLILIVFLSQHSSLANLLPIVKAPEVLTEQARQIAAKLGYVNSPADEGHWFDLDPAYYRYSSRIPAPLRFRGLAEEFPLPLEFWYRQSPFALQTHYPFTVTATNPVSFYSGEWRIGMDSAARLNYFAAIGPQEEATPDQRALDWQQYSRRQTWICNKVMRWRPKDSRMFRAIRASPGRLFRTASVSRFRGRAITTKLFSSMSRHHGSKRNGLALPRIPLLHESDLRFSSPPYSSCWRRAFCLHAEI
jgi:hypothetical protein